MRDWAVEGDSQSEASSRSQQCPGCVREGFGGATGTRTLDLLHAMQALFQLSYSPTRTRMLHEPDGLACDLIGRPKDRPDRVQSTTLGALRRYACKVATTTTEWRAI